MTSQFLTSLTACREQHSSRYQSAWSNCIWRHYVAGSEFRTVKKSPGTRDVIYPFPEIKGDNLLPSMKQMLRYLFRSVSRDTKNTSSLKQTLWISSKCLQWHDEIYRAVRHKYKPLHANRDEKERKSDTYRAANTLKSDLIHTHTHTHTHRSSPYRAVNTLRLGYKKKAIC